MKINAITDLEKFFDVIDRCEGKVELVTKEGDRYNLNSKLSQLVAATKVLSTDAALDAELIASDSEEEKKIIAFLKVDKIKED